jgi:indolepyruvate ferredoxin oxidoreductase beta subunit
MKIVNIVLCGLGGQGILFMTRVLAQAGLDKGFNVLGAETHGMAQRGGSVISHLRFGDVQGSMVRSGTAHFLFALNEDEGYRNLAFLSRGGHMFVNTDPNGFPRPEVKEFLENRQISSRAFLASLTARDLGAPRCANLALLGFFSAFYQEPIRYTELKTTIEKLSPSRLKEINNKVFEEGYNKGEVCKGNISD